MTHSSSYSYSLMPTVLGMLLMNLDLSIAALNPVNISAMLKVFDIFCKEIICSFTYNFILNFS